MGALLSLPLLAVPSMGTVSSRASPYHAMSHHRGLPKEQQPANTILG